jgi:hypothetical protein
MAHHQQVGRPKRRSLFEEGSSGNDPEDFKLTGRFAPRGDFRKDKRERFAGMEGGG